MNTPRLGFRSAVLLVAALFAGSMTVGCTPPRASATMPDIAPLPWEDQARVPRAAMSLCSIEPPQPVSIGLHVLVDASGSMAGFLPSGVLPVIHQWVGRAASDLGALGVTVASRRLSAFSQRVGVREISQGELAHLPVGSNTNLDSAVAAASESELSVLVTDGVPFSGDTSSAGCASGTDIGCVAQRFTEALHGAAEPGLWLIPLVVQHQGKLYLEGQKLPRDISANGLAESIRRVFPESEVSIALQADNPQDESASSAPMTYRGPKVLLLFVLSHDHKVGRSFVRTLLQGAQQAQLQSLGSSLAKFNNRQSASGILRPIEIFPGFLPRIVSIHGASQRPEGRGNFSGIIDVTSPETDQRRGQRARFEVACRPEKEGWEVWKLDYHLTDFDAPPSEGCGAIFSLPGMGLSIAPDAVQPALGTALKNILPRGRIDEPEALLDGAKAKGAVPGTVVFRCPASSVEALPDCGHPGVASVAAIIDYKKSAQAITAPGPTSGGDEDIFTILDSLSTLEIPREPHKVLGLKALAHQILESAGSQARATPLAAFEVCGERRGK